MSWLEQEKANGHLTSYSFGTLLLPETLRNGQALTLETAQVLKVETTRWHTSGRDGVRRMTAVLWDIPSEEYATQVAARMYLKITLANGKETVIYSGFSSGDNVRSIQYVAQAALNDTSVSYDAEEMAVLRSYAGNNT